jgi:diguanylate cyclase (GGDEF)-like protein/PAS domain S-box-containing protein
MSNKNITIATKLSRSTFQTIATVVFVAEALLMMILQYLPQYPTYKLALIDASLLVACISPILYFLLFKPLHILIKNYQLINQQLLENEKNKFETLLRASIDGFWVVDFNGSFLDVNDAYCQLMGYSREELLSMGIQDVEASESTEETAQHIAKIIETGSDRFETKHLSKSGEVINIEVSTHYSDYQGGRFYCFLRDITEQKKHEMSLCYVNERLKLATRAGGVGLWDWDITLNTLNWDEYMFVLYGFTQKQPKVSYDLWRTTIHPDDVSRIELEIQQALNGEKYFDAEFRIVWPNGSIHYIRAFATVTYDISGNPLRMLGTNWDRTERKLNEYKLEVLLFEQRLMLENDLVGIMKVKSRKITWANPYFERLLGRSKGELNGLSTRQLYLSDHDFLSLGAEAYPLLNNGEIYRTQIQMVHKNGNFVWVEMSGAMLNKVTSETFWTVIDITDSTNYAKEIENLAYYDQLTNLPNRRLLLERLQWSLATSNRSGKDGALLFIDLDHFKMLNDMYGHVIGDMLLKQVGERISACIRRSDNMERLAHLGGDEFVITIDGLSENVLEASAQAEMISQKILNILNQPYKLDTYEYQSTASIGVALFSDHVESSENLLKHADIAMYQAKQAGGNVIRFFNPKMQEAIDSRVGLELELRKAMDKEQFKLFYQIQVDDLGNALGAEALIRWVHPERGLVSPFHFIPLAEETGLILNIGNWVLETACSQLKAWEQDPLTRKLTISINVSAKQFNQANFAKQVESAIQHHAVNPTMLKLELTESMLLDNIEHVSKTMEALGNIGIQFSLDDFGTGYSSLLCLKMLPMNQLKIDQSFVRDIVQDINDRSIVSTIIAMAQSLSMDVIAEGVETDAQRELLIQMGCKKYQGYLFGKPVPVDQFESSITCLSKSIQYEKIS